MRIYSRVLEEAEIGHVAKATRAAWLVGKTADQRSETEIKELFEWWLTTFDKPTQDLSARLAEIEKEQSND